MRIQFHNDSEKKWIPDGFHFLGTEESKNRRKITNRLHEFFLSNGFLEVIPPAIDFTSSFHNHVSESDRGMILKARDISGNEVSPSVDLTLQVVKGLAGYSSEKIDTKVYYISRTIKDSDKMTISRREVLQAGAELIGNSNGSTIKEIISLIDGILVSFEISTPVTLVLGNINVPLAILQKLNIDLKNISEIIPAIYSKNIPELRDILFNSEDENLKNSLIKILLEFEVKNILPILHELNLNYSLGLENIIRESEEIVEYSKSLNKLNLCLDFSLFRDLDYYTGFIFQGYVGVEPTPLITGGAYDQLFEKFTGLERKASGFALNVDILEDVLLEKINKYNR